MNETLHSASDRPGTVEMLQTALESVSQGICMFDAQSRLTVFNQRFCELLEVPESWLSTHPTLQELVTFQTARGDFGPHLSWVEEHARTSIAANVSGPVASYLRTTTAGRTLEIKSHPLADGAMVRTVTDVTDYVQAQADRRRLNQLLDVTQAITKMGGWDADFVNNQLVWTSGIYRMLDTSPQEYTPTPDTVGRFFTPAARELIRASYADVVNQPTEHNFELEMITAKGRHIWVHSMGTTVWEQGRPVRRTATLQDVTERRLAQAALRETEARWRLALDSTGDGVWDWHIPSGAEFFSARLKEMYGYEEDEMLDRSADNDSRVHPDDDAQRTRDLQAHFDGLTASYKNEHRRRCKDGSWKWVLSRGMVISRDSDGKPLRMIGTHTDISARKESEALIWQQANFDALTGLPNRRMLRDRIEQEVRQSKRDGSYFALLLIDLDHFKEVNDTLGHDQGDRLLVEAARRISSCVRQSDTVARMGGDEFTVVLNEMANNSQLERVLQQLLQSLSAVFQLDNEQVFVSASIGVTIYPLDTTDIESLFKNADQALYVAKGTGRNRFSFFTPALQEAAQNRLRIANDLRTGLDLQQFRAVYQPIVDLSNGATYKAEVLIRWQHPTRGLISPANFIPIAETSGLIVDIGEWVFAQAAAQVQRWRTIFHPDFQISINKSPVQFQHGKTHLPWIRRLHALGLPGNSMVVEITEGLLLDTSASVTEQLREQHEAGIQVSLDDFGTGYSSLSYLQKFDMDFVKIDQSFVRHLVAGSTDLILCNAIIAMAHALGLKVIAEGVETELQRDLLAAAGCDYAQGYLFAKPLSPPDFEAWMAARRQ